ncbi:isoprenylcysteine carboxylmethyltransferase family protein [Roseisolibacter sp. H3M3-2]|uniref:methyltransferase family protein n=1 Tax=Roseisolibacter sp. H3M3-2 TaxID=3031323 RepID=UPI0023D9F275|nr:isoprenylcysteine carboxylmethyltransferase family protein [Roseisolibacter sp. H3M3-2]MDF1503520.1 isoprenylcysteine carboxylmethyltransferase family protein [Roseisolibacter sp. H3M3-2]
MSKPFSIQRLRVPLGFVVAALYLWAATRSDALTWGSVAVGGAVALVGLLIRAWAAGHIVKNDRLATTGPYAHTRNPLYFGSFLLAAGCALAVHWTLLLAVAGFWLLVYAPVIRRERDFVRARFPEAYAEWERHVPAFVPRLTPWRGSGNGHVAADAPPFDLKLYLFHREWQAALGYAAVMAWLAYWTWRRGG